MPTGETFDSDGIRIAYDDLHPEGDGDAPPVVLVHGFASSRGENWRDREWYETLLEDGRRVIAMDCRGHGESEKPHDPAAYETDVMAADVARLLDHLGIEQADFLGYSMGGRIGTEALYRHPERFNAAVLAGIGAATREPSDAGDRIADGLLADDPDDVTDPLGKRFRVFAETADNDLEALAACARTRTAPADWDDISGVDHPVVIVAGLDDDITCDPEPLADGFSNGEAVVIDGKDHLTTVPDERFTEAVLGFLEREGL
ncbi:alpha/beta hydrolase fold protein [Natrinema pellirubrum DSM 15624]|uniref:Alpha/beta hydrolase fold protein n=1 Tax=Natrinema pellirubrum (strain DSM 15624 / CIP 106293 / JCM 10476 / NCIMB 786 / 157) TaxID=797303 RepID=L0JJ75_NATP1|nr:alpha/beta hydrolase [Natrinema pellirubrum]AGB30637.1 putative hydrolase or acyltransferase of alpha/beta superfamily [Natrinema pellirubrum DSM 15624]ELY74888.1 alpha/beta hydrolase fold protein [Natrinema pellirubrum DSM 15624]